MERHQTVLVIDFGGQYNQLIVRRVRNLGVYAELVPNDISIEKIKSKNGFVKRNFNSWRRLEKIG